MSKYCCKQEYDYWKSLIQKTKYLLTIMQTKNLSLRSAFGIAVLVRSYLTTVLKGLKSLEICGTLSSYKIQVFQMWISI